MGKPTGFREVGRETPARRPATLRVLDWREVYEAFPDDSLRAQASRCMDCGIPFCHHGCPLGNRIPDWNDLIYRDRWHEAAARLHATNNFPEFTGRLCPAPCESACVLGLHDLPVTIKQVEAAVADRAFDAGWLHPQPAAVATGRRVAIIGSGPAGLAAAQQLARRGHAVVVFERADRVGGLLRYGIPDFKMDKALLDRRLAQLAAEGVTFRTGVQAGVDMTGAYLRTQFDAICLAVGATRARTLDVPGADLRGVHLAMDYLGQQNRLIAGDAVPEAERLVATGRRVIILGGGDTGADCLGTALRQGAASVRQFEIAPRPPDARSESDPWPLWPHVYRVSAAHEEGGEREFAAMTTHLEGDGGTLTRLHAVRVQPETRDGRTTFVPIPGSAFSEPVDLLLLATGFIGPDASDLPTQLGVRTDVQGRIVTDGERTATSAPGVFAAGDARRGASLVVWAIAEGRRAADDIDHYLQALPS